MRSQLLGFLTLLLFVPCATAQSLYEGALFDTSFQAGGENNKYLGSNKSTLISQRWTDHNVEGGTVFVGIDMGDDDEDDDSRERVPGEGALYLKKLRNTLRSKDVKYFMNIAAMSDDGPAEGVSINKYRQAIGGIKTLFKKPLNQVVPNIVSGVGEIEQYAWTDDNFHVDNPKMMKFLHRIVDKYSFPFAMIHFPGGPGSTNFKKLPEIETTHFANVLNAHPDVNFLVHLFLPDFLELANSGGLQTLLDNHPNWIFSVDVGNMMGRWQNGTFRCPLMYCCSDDGLCESNDTDKSPAAVNAFISEYDLNRDSMLSQALSVYQSYIEAYPTRFAWGTENGKL